MVDTFHTNFIHQSQIMEHSNVKGNIIRLTYIYIYIYRASLVAQRVKHLPAMQETQVRFLGWEDLLEKEIATHSSNLAWKIPWMEKPGRLQSMGTQRVGHDWATSLYIKINYTRQAYDLEIDKDFLNTSENYILKDTDIYRTMVKLRTYLNVRIS